MRSALMAFALGALVAPCAMAGDVSVADAWVRETIGAGKVSAGYARIVNASTAPDRLLSVATSAGVATLHRTLEQRGMMTMDAVQAIEVPGKGNIELKPGSYHIMIMNVAHPLRVGEAVDLVFTFEHAGKVNATAKVAPIAAIKAP
jgi:copper(I)-binding protein